MKNFAFLVVAALLIQTSSHAQQAQASAPGPAAVPAPPSAPALSPEQRRKFAEVREALNRDPEYSAAVKRVQEAQKTADKIFFDKLRKAAPDLSDYIRSLENARGLGKPAQP